MRQQGDLGKEISGESGVGEQIMLVQPCVMGDGRKVDGVGG